MADRRAALRHGRVITWVRGMTHAPQSGISLGIDMCCGFCEREDIVPDDPDCWPWGLS